jgi:hypothetical protein
MWPPRGGRIERQKGVIMELFLVAIAAIMGLGLVYRWTRTRTAH